MSIRRTKPISNSPLRGYSRIGFLYLHLACVISAPFCIVRRTSLGSFEEKEREKAARRQRKTNSAVQWVSLPLFSALLRLSDLWPMSGQKKCSYSPGFFLSMGVKGQTTCRQWARLLADAAAHSALFLQVISPLDNWVLWPEKYIVVWGIWHCGNSIHLSLQQCVCDYDNKVIWYSTV